MSEVSFDNEPVDKDDVAKYRQRLAAARGARSRPVGPPRADMPTFQEIDSMKHEVAPHANGDPTMSTSHLEQLAQTPDPTRGLAVPGIRRETAEGLKGLADHLQSQEQPAQAPPPPSAAAPAPEAPDEQEDGVYEEQLAALLEQRAESPVRRIFSSSRKKDLESKLPAIDLADLLLNQDARQTVPLGRGMSVTFRSLNGHENMFTASHVWAMFRGNLTTEMHELAKGLVGLTLAVVQVGDHVLTEHRTDAGKVNPAAFQTKWEEMLRYPSFLLEAMDLNRVWFVERCSNALSMDEVGNG